MLGEAKKLPPCLLLCHTRLTLLLACEHSHKRRETHILRKPQGQVLCSFYSPQAESGAFLINQRGGGKAVIPRVPVGDCWDAVYVWQAWVWVLAVCLYMHIHTKMDVCGVWVGALRCIWRCHKSVHNSNPKDGVYSMEGVWDSVE